MLKLIALCHYHLYVAFYTLDHADLLLGQFEANDPSNVWSFFWCCFCLWSWWTHKRQSTKTVDLLNGVGVNCWTTTMFILTMTWIPSNPRQWRSTWRPTYLRGSIWLQDAMWKSFTFTRCVPSIITLTISKGMWLVHVWTPGKLWHASVTNHFWGAWNGLGFVVTRQTWWKDCSRGTSYS